MLNPRKVKDLQNIKVQIRFLSISIDVHVKILGKQENTKIAKERVLEKLDARVSH